jgi:hypothetical protein
MNLGRMTLIFISGFIIYNLRILLNVHIYIYIVLTNESLCKMKPIILKPDD